MVASSEAEGWMPLSQVQETVDLLRAVKREKTKGGEKV